MIHTCGKSLDRIRRHCMSNGECTCGFEEAFEGAMV